MKIMSDLLDLCDADKAKEVAMTESTGFTDNVTWVKNNESSGKELG